MLKAKKWPQGPLVKETVLMLVGGGIRVMKAVTMLILNLSHSMVESFKRFKQALTSLTQSLATSKMLWQQLRRTSLRFKISLVRSKSFHHYKTYRSLSKSSNNNRDVQIHMIKTAFHLIKRMLVVKITAAPHLLEHVLWCMINAQRAILICP